MIKHINLDPNGLCNAKCWFCPVAYLGNPKENRTNMSIETMEDILKQIDNGRGDFVDPDIQIKNNPIHFNEILLYPYFKEMLDLHRKYNIKMYVFSNGLNLTPEKTELIKEYSDVVTDVLLNIPSIEKTQWSNFTGFNIKLFDKLIDNISYANNNLYPSFSGEQLMIFVNGLDNNKNITKLKNAPIYKDGELIEITKNIQKMFPNFRVMLRNNLSDRKIKIKDKLLHVGLNIQKSTFIFLQQEMFIYVVQIFLMKVYMLILKKNLLKKFGKAKKEKI